MIQTAAASSDFVIMTPRPPADMDAVAARRLSDYLSDLFRDRNFLVVRSGPVGMDDFAVFAMGPDEEALSDDSMLAVAEIKRAICQFHATGGARPS